MHNKYFLINNFIEVNTLIEAKLGEFIVDKMLKREKPIVMQKKLEVTVITEFAKLFRDSIINSLHPYQKLFFEEN